MVAGVVALAEQDGNELGPGLEVGAGLAGRFHATVEVHRPSAQSVAKHPSVRFLAEPGHGRCLDLRRQRSGCGCCVVEGIDLGGDGFVLVGDDAVGDAGVREGHLHGAMAEERGDRFEAHASVDGLGSQGVAELVGMDVADAGLAGGGGHDAVHGAPVDRGVVVGEEPALGPDVGGVGSRPLSEELDEVGVQRDAELLAIQEMVR